MRRIIPWTLLAAVVLTLALVGPALAQDASGPAAIISFTSSVPFISIPELESGEVTATLNWHAVGLDDNQRLVLDRYDLNNFVSLLTTDETTLPASGTRDVTVANLSGFAPPTFRLAILDFRNRIIDQQIVTIPVVALAEGETTSVDFSVDASTLSPTALAAGNARVTVTWDINNRPPTANPVFEQLLPGGEAVNVELPRDVLWVPSSGSGPVAPVAPETGSTIDLRIRVVDMVDGTVYGESFVSLPTSGETAPEAPTDAADTTAEAPVATSAATITSFTAEPQSVPLGEAVQLNWVVTGASSVQISVRTGTSIEQQLIAGNLPLRAGLMIPVTPDVFGDAPSLTFVLRMVDAQGNSLGLGRADVTVGAATAPETTVEEAATEPVEATPEALG